MNLIESKGKIVLGELKADFINILERDVQFLSKHNLMDYSLLVAVEKFTSHEDDELYFHDLRELVLNKHKYIFNDK